MVLNFVSRDKTLGSGRHFLLLGARDVGHCECMKLYKPVWFVCSKSSTAIYGFFLVCCAETTYTWPSHFRAESHSLNPRSFVSCPWELRQTLHFPVPQLWLVLRKWCCLPGRMLEWINDPRTWYIIVITSIPWKDSLKSVCIWNLIHSL